MQLTDIQQEQTAAYIKRELSGAELIDFEAALDENEQLQDEVVFQKKLSSALTLRAVKTAVKQAQKDNLLEDKTREPKVEDIHAAMQKARVDNSRQRQIRHWLVGGLAAACVLLMGMFGLHQSTVNQQYAKIEHEIELWQVDFEMSDTGYESVSGTDDVEENIQIAKKQYAADKPEQALATLNLISEDELLYHVLLAKGQIHAQLKDYEESSRLLELAIKSDEIMIKDEAYLALGTVYLRMSKKHKAREKLGQIHTASMKKEAGKIIQTYF